MNRFSRIFCAVLIFPAALLAQTDDFDDTPPVHRTAKPSSGPAAPRLFSADVFASNTIVCNSLFQACSGKKTMISYGGEFRWGVGVKLFVGLDAGRFPTRSGAANQLGAIDAINITHFQLNSGLILPLYKKDERMVYGLGGIVIGETHYDGFAYYKQYVGMRTGFGYQQMIGKGVAAFTELIFDNCRTTMEYTIPGQQYNMDLFRIKLGIRLIKTSPAKQ